MPERLGDLAVVLHSHMPYVEGFGTYPFGEEWLFDAVGRSYLPVLERARDLTITVSPVLADQLEAPGVAERLEAFLHRYRLEAAEREAAKAPGELRPAAAEEAERYRRALSRLEAFGGEPLQAFHAAAAERNVALIPSAASHAVLPLIATTSGLRLQVDAGLRSHRRRFGAAQGFWLPECAYRPGIEPRLAEQGLRFFCTDQSAGERPLEALAPVRAGAGLVAFTIDWEAVELVWSPRAIRPTRRTPSSTAFRRRACVSGRSAAIRTTLRRPTLAPRATRRTSPAPWRSGFGHSANSAESPA